MCLAECLTDIDEEAVQLFSLKPGDRLCVNCNKRYIKEKETDYQIEKDNCTGEYEMSADRDCEFGSPREVAVEFINKSAENLQCSPLYTSGLHQRDRAVYGKRKVKQLNSAIKVKCAKALDLSMNEFDSSSETEDDSCNDLKRLMTLLKKKVRNASRQMKIKLLTLASESWTIKRVIQNLV